MNNTRNTRTIIILLLVSYLAIHHVYAERKTFTFSADYTSAILAEGKEFTLLRGNAQVLADDIQITAGEIKLYGDDFQFAEVNEKFTALDLKNDFSLEGDNLFYNRTEKLLRTEGNIVMKDKKNDLVIRAHFLESKNDGEFMIVQLGVRITKTEDLSARTEFLTYYRETEVLEMTGFPYALWKEDEYSADRVSINLDTDEVILEGKVQGFISTVQEDNNGEENNSNTEDTEDSAQNTESTVSNTEEENNANTEDSPQNTESTASDTEEENADTGN